MMKKIGILVLALPMIVHARTYFESEAISLKQPQSSKMKKVSHGKTTSITLAEDANETIYISTNGIRRPATTLFKAESALEEADKIWFDGAHTVVYKKNDMLYGVYPVVSQCRYTMPEAQLFVGAYYNPQYRQLAITPILPHRQFAEYCFVVIPEGVKRFVGEPVPNVLKAQESA